MAQSEITRFKRAVWAYARAHGRHDLPWRNLPAGRQGHVDPYKILVSEIMLQQTQVERVIPFYLAFVRRFPTARHLARAPLGEVLRAWQGLGYNRRAKMLREAARAITKEGMPTDARELERLPGVGPYTARAVAAFASNQDCIFVETNIRTAVIWHFFRKKRSVSDREILEILRRAAPDVALAKSGAWYSALMDYGAHLKRTGTRVNARSAHYTKQSRFTGSSREARGAIIRELAKGERGKTGLENLLGRARRAQLRAALRALVAEQLVQKLGRRYALAR